MESRASIVGLIPSEWRVATIGELCDTANGSVQTGPFGSQLHVSDYKPVGTPVVMPKNLGRNEIIDSDVARIGHADVERLSRHRLEVGDIIFPRRGDISRYAHITERYTGWLCGTGCLRIRLGGGEINSLFLAYYLGHPAVQQWIINNAVGTTMLNLNTSIISALPVSLPSLPEQNCIAGILQALDDKIELNHQMNRTLEAIARAIFKSWFVDFDPVWAKLDGEQPCGMDAETAALFPAAFVESELGLIPEGWRVKDLPEAIEVNPRRSLSKGKIAPYLAMADMPISSALPQNWGMREFGSGMRFINGDVLVARITPCLENGKTAFASFLDDEQVGWGSTEYIVFRSKAPLPLEYTYFLARTPEFRSHAIVNMTGTSGRQRVPRDCFDHYPVTVPSEPIAAYFGEIAGNFMTKMKQNDEESRTLTQLRDTLLPKLISGQLRVPDAEKLAGNL